jgi:hypothetical protein
VPRQVKVISPPGPLQPLPALDAALTPPPDVLVVGLQLCLFEPREGFSYCEADVIDRLIVGGGGS